MPRDAAYLENEVGVMPKEVIRSKEPHSTVALNIGWSVSGTFVQAAMNGGPNGTGLYVHLDRDAVNRLIRSLRKARDQAFGSDA